MAITKAQRDEANIEIMARCLYAVVQPTGGLDYDELTEGQKDALRLACDEAVQRTDLSVPQVSRHDALRGSARLEAARGRTWQWRLDA